jgi:hypothetical protein
LEDFLFDLKVVMPPAAVPDSPGLLSAFSGLNFTRTSFKCWAEKDHHNDSKVSVP